MDVSIFLAKVFGIYLVIVSLSLLINRQKFKQLFSDFLNNSPAAFLSAIMTLIMGILLILFHNIWTTDWRVLITLLSWLVFVKGAVRVLCPKFDSLFVGMVNKESFYAWAGGIYLILGGYLLYLGYFC